MTSESKLAETAFTPGPWDYCKPARRWLVYPKSALNDGIDYYIAEAINVDGRDQEAKANARLIASAPDLLRQRDELLAAMKRIRLWLAEENCDEPLRLADAALIAAGVMDVTCPICQGDGEWDEGPLPARSSTQIDPEYRQVKCPECGATGRIAISAALGGNHGQN